MGPDGDPKAVLNSRFQVRGVTGLRVVDASIFPNIPGYFIVTNIYMASEKAADVILRDAARSDVCEQSVYPAGLRKLESEAIAMRRKRLTCSTEAANESEIAAVGGVGGNSRRWANDVTGLALSGGGIRSATLCLGVLQSFAKAQWLRKIDILSTVSGGGYVGGFLGRLFDRFRRLDRDNKESQSVADPALAVEQVLNSPDSRAVDWLRRHGNYLAPQGGGDGRTNFAVFVRNLLSAHLVVGLALFTLFGLSNGFRYTLLDKLSTSLGLVFDSSSMPIGHLVSSWSGAFFSPWFLLLELLILFLVVPRIIAYWIVSQDQHESFKPVTLSILIAVSGVFLLSGVQDGAKPELIFSGLSLLTSIVHVELAWRRGTQVEAAMGTGSVETRRLRTRNYLTYDLGLALALTVGALVFVLIDTVGHGLVEWQILKNVAYAKAFAALIAAIMTAMPVGRWLTSFLTEESPGRPSTIVRILKSAMVPGAMAVVLFTLPLVFYLFASHASFGGGQTLWLGWILTLGAAVLTCALALPSAVSFVNRSSLAATYSARLARAYLGASNPLRHRPGGADVTEVMDGDDVPSIRDYKPHEASGPLHLINLTLNQTVDVASQLSKRDRKGENLAVSCIGMTVGEKWHSVWANSGSIGDFAGTRVPTRLEPVGWVTGTKHPLVDQLDRPADQAEMLSLRQWIGLSGAAIDGGRGRGTQLGLSLLMGLINIRTGYWWDSEIAHADRCGFPELSFTRRLLYLVPRFFATQCLLLYEWVARYPGPWERFWHFSDGGFFENLGCYELIRRRIPRIIVCDCGADPEFEFEDLGELVRKARIDFGATIHEFTPSDIAAYVPQQIQNRIGSLEELVPVASTGSGPPKSPKHVTLFWIRFADDPEQRCVMLYVKATVGVDSPVDVQNYHTKHPEFPHEATADQFFDETQWESYRRLGELLSADLVNAQDNNGNPARNWFWQIPVS